jgi:hypothetical protein
MLYSDRMPQNGHEQPSRHQILRTQAKACHRAQGTVTPRDQAVSSGIMREEGSAFVFQQIICLALGDHFLQVAYARRRKQAKLETPDWNTDKVFCDRGRIPGFNLKDYFRTDEAWIKKDNIFNQPGLCHWG